METNDRGRAGAPPHPGSPILSKQHSRGFHTWTDKIDNRARLRRSSAAADRCNGRNGNPKPFNETPIRPAHQLLRRQRQKAAPSPHQLQTVFTCRKLLALMVSHKIAPTARQTVLRHACATLAPAGSPAGPRQTSYYRSRSRNRSSEFRLHTPGFSDVGAQPRLAAFCNFLDRENHSESERFDSRLLVLICGVSVRFRGCSPLSFKKFAHNRWLAGHLKP